MHAGVLALLIIICLGLIAMALSIASYRDDEDSIGPVIWFAIGGTMILVAVIFLIVPAIDRNACEVRGRDLSVAIDHSWLAGCRVPAEVDGRVIYIEPDDIELIDRLDLWREVTDAQK